MMDAFDEAMRTGDIGKFYGGLTCDLDWRANTRQKRPNGYKAAKKAKRKNAKAARRKNRK